MMHLPSAKTWSQINLRDQDCNAHIKVGIGQKISKGTFLNQSLNTVATGNFLIGQLDTATIFLKSDQQLYVE